MLRDPRCGIDCIMSHSHSESFDWEAHNVRRESGERSNVLVSSPGTSCDVAIDVALRSVSLPDGLLSRLSALVAVMPEEATEHADWLGC